MIFSLLFGALLYGLVQFVWYSPLLFGREWLGVQQITPEQAIARLEKGGVFPESIQGIVLPAVLMSAAVHTLMIVFGRLGYGYFFLMLLVLFLLTVIKKYRHWSRVSTTERKGWYIQDGALFCSLLLLGIFVLTWKNTLY